MKEKVSVIVPIYNVEKYIHRCINSILNQSYKDIEVILVNDGSPDKCGTIIDEYVKKDSRVMAIHKDNGGLSDARNAGMELVTGEFVIFVDSDDWLEKDFINQLLVVSRTSQADIVQSGFYYAYDNHLLYDNRFFNLNSEPVILDNKGLMLELVKNDKVKNFAWGKLYKTCLIRDIPFKKGVLFEDVFWAHNVMKRVDKYVIIHRPMYFYFQRSDSIVANYTPRNLDIIEGLKDRHKFIEKHYKYLTNESYKVLLKTCLIHYKLLMVNRKIDGKGIYKGSIKNYISENYINIKNAVSNDKSLKTELIMFQIHPFLNIMFMFLKKTLRSLKIINDPIVLKKIELSNGGNEIGG